MAEEKKSKDGKIRLLIATDNFLPRWDGISRFLAEMIPRLKGKYDITVICPDFGPIPQQFLVSLDSVKLVRFKTSSMTFGDFNIPKPDHKIVKREVQLCDMVFSQTIGPLGLSVMRAAKKEKKKIASYIHSVEWELVTMALGIHVFKRQSYAMAKKIIRRIYKKPDLLIFPSQSIEELFSWHQIHSPKEVIHLGVDTSKFTPAANKDDAKKKVMLDTGVFVIGYHGRIAREKDLMTLLRAFIIVKKQNPKVVLLIVGDGLESIKKKLNGVKGVMVTGQSDNVVPYLQAMDVFCLPSLTETTSLTTLEAMACGVPPIVNKVGFVKDYIKDKKNGLFFTGKDSYDLAKQITLLIKNEELRKSIGVAARKFTEKEFDWDLTAKRLDQTFSKLI
jgi:glycosyltransferase involved in cell wall biosynthesis